MNPLRLQPLRDLARLQGWQSPLPECPIRVEARKIPDNFLDGFRNRDCASTDCSACGYCERVGTGIGAAAGGAAAGAAIGTVAGPVGTIAGAAVGAIIGGLAGKGVAEKVNPTAEAAYWRREHPNQAYARGRVYEEFDPAYRVGYENYSELGASGATFEQAEPELRKRYHSKTGSKLKWEEVSPASRAAWNRLAQQQKLSNSTKP